MLIWDDVGTALGNLRGSRDDHGIMVFVKNTPMDSQWLTIHEFRR